MNLNMNVMIREIRDINGEIKVKIEKMRKKL